MKNILVTGGAGFIGSHLCARLLADGHAVCALDNFFTGTRENIAALMRHEHFRVVAHDVNAPYEPEVKFDQIYNLACPASPVHYQFDPVRTVTTNVLGTLHMLELARTTGATLLQASTSEVYGDPKVHPQPESYHGNVNPIGPRACYDEGKRCAETLCFDYHRQYGVRIKVVRIFNTYGPNMRADDGRVVSNFICQALKNEPITIYGEGQQTRSFCYVDDMVEGFVRMMETPENVTGPVNLGNPGEFTIRQLAEQVVRMTGSKSQLSFKPLPQDDPTQRKPDIALAQQWLGWQPKVALEEGLVKTVEYFRGAISA